MRKIIFLLVCIINLFAANVQEIEPNNNKQNATPISIYDTGIGSLSSNDNIDWWKFTVPQNGILTVYVLANNLIDSNEFSYDDYQLVSDGEGNVYYLYSIEGSVNKDQTYYLKLKKVNGIVYYELYFSFSPDYSSINTVNFHPIFNENLNGELNVIGNHNVCETNDGRTCIDPGNADNNNIYQYYVNVDPNSNYINSSEADLNLKTGDKIVKAYLFWMGRIRTDDPNNDDSVSNANKVEFKTPTTNGYVEVDANSSSFNWYYGSDGVFDYGAYADVTQYVTKSGQYYVANLQVSEGENTSGGWSLVVVTENPQDEYKKIVVYQGFQAIFNSRGYPPSVTQLLNNFYTPINGPVNASFILFANETDRDLDDNISLTDKNGNIHYLSNALNPADNVLNCTISKFGVNVTNRNPNFENTLGVDIDEFNVSDIINNGQTETNITINSNGDRVFLNMFGISIQLYVPKVCYYDFNLYDENNKTIAPGSAINLGQEVKVAFKIKNDENESAKDVYIIYPFDENNMTEYVHNSTYVKNVLQSNYISLDDNQTQGNLGVYVDNNTLNIGVLGDSNNVFLPYDVNNSYIAGIEFGLKLKKEGNLSFVFYADYNYTLGNENYTYHGRLPKCSDFEVNYNVYNPPLGTFNVVNENFSGNTDPINSNDPLNALYTQVINKPFNVKIVHLDNDNKTIKSIDKATVMLEVVDASNINSDNFTCKNARLLYKFPLNDDDLFNNESIKNIDNLIIPIIFKNATFRIKYIDWDDLFIKKDFSCSNSSFNGNLKGVPACLDSKEKINQVFPGNPCVDESTGAPCNPNNHGHGNPPYDNDYGCAMCLLDYNSSYVCARDRFAIRPDRFEIINNNSRIVAGKEFNLTLKAVDPNGNPVKDYNESVNINGNSPDLEYNISKKGCDNGVLTGNAEFKDGEANITLIYNEVGDLNLTLKEVNGSEFAKIDENDTNDSDRLIEEDKTQIHIIPDHFEINGLLKNYSDSNFTYLSKDLNMSSVLELNIMAQNALNQITKNYNEKCYAKDINVTIKTNLNPHPKNLNNFIYEYTYDANDTNSSVQEVNITKNIEINYSKENFTTEHNGTTDLTVYINFDRNSSKTVNPFDMNISEVNVTNPDEVNGTNSTISGKANYFYGRIKISDAAGIGQEVNTTFYYDYWTDIDGWKINTEHNDTVFGDYNKSKSYFPNDVDFVTLPQNEKNILEGNEKIKFTTTHMPPYSAKIHLSIPSWLWYNPLAKDYKDPSSANLDCLTHPCMKVNFYPYPSGWHGPSGGSEELQNEYNVLKRTAEINASKEGNISKKEVKKINW